MVGVNLELDLFHLRFKSPPSNDVLRVAQTRDTVAVAVAATKDAGMGNGVDLTCNFPQ